VMGDNIGGIWPFLAVFVPPVLGTTIGAVMGGPQHRVKGGLIGFGAGIAAIFAIGAVINYRNQTQVAASMVSRSTLNQGATYALTHTDGSNPTADEATAAGFTSVQLLTGGATGPNGELVGTWIGADNAPVPAGLVARS
jgi:hypothetical protein